MECKRYLLFWGDCYYPASAADILGLFDTVEEALNYPERYGNNEFKYG